ncbi:uncharacterized protein LOC112559928 [Pomacea canaliculata]|nr:uncharacterized protein LOC112559928 [Pomacea canaliculata]
MADGLETFQKRSCELGINSHHCALAHLDDVMMARDFLRSGYSPGKRSADLPEDLSSKLRELLDDLNHQMTEVTKLRRMLDDINTQPMETSKRTCQFRLGNHCLTEALDRAASQYYYLKSALSPGRRRRQAQDNDNKMKDNRQGSNRRR